MEKLVSYLQQKKHRGTILREWPDCSPVTSVDVQDVPELLLKKKFHSIACWSKILPEMLSANGTSFMEVFKKNNTGVPFLSMFVRVFAQR